MDEQYFFITFFYTFYALSLHRLREAGAVLRRRHSARAGGEQKDEREVPSAWCLVPPPKWRLSQSAVAQGFARAAGVGLPDERSEEPCEARSQEAERAPPMRSDAPWGWQQPKGHFIITAYTDDSRCVP